MSREPEHIATVIDRIFLLNNQNFNEMSDSQDKPSRGTKNAIEDARFDAEVWGRSSEQIYIPGVGYLTVGGKPKQRAYGVLNANKARTDEGEGE